MRPYSYKYIYWRTYCLNTNHSRWHILIAQGKNLILFEGVQCSALLVLILCHQGTYLIKTLLGVDFHLSLVTIYTSLNHSIVCIFYTCLDLPIDFKINSSLTLNKRKVQNISGKYMNFVKIQYIFIHRNSYYKFSY